MLALGHPVGLGLAGLMFVLVAIIGVHGVAPYSAGPHPDLVSDGSDDFADRGPQQPMATTGTPGSVGWTVDGIPISGDHRPSLLGLCVATLGLAVLLVTRLSAHIRLRSMLDIQRLQIRLPGQACTADTPSLNGLSLLRC